MKKPSLEKRIELLEAGEASAVPGTSLVRILLPEGGFGWSLGLGHMAHPKKFYTGKTIAEVFEKAEKDWK